MTVYIAHMTALELLDLSETDVGDDGIMKLARPIMYGAEDGVGGNGSAGLRSLSHLNLRGTSITDAAVRYIVQFPNLCALDMSHTNVTHFKGIKRLCEPAHAWQLLPVNMKLFHQEAVQPSFWRGSTKPTESHDDPEFGRLDERLREVVLRASYYPTEYERSWVWEYVTNGRSEARVVWRRSIGEGPSKATWKLIRRAGRGSLHVDSDGGTKHPPARRRAGLTPLPQSKRVKVESGKLVPDAMEEIARSFRGSDPSHPTVGGKKLWLR
ncbi:hypothetical protein HK104_000006 [Borealophlyctis nickersoniae]|nr:hypothetical protein HK104_000006 [Borealophlyctis nickersoniae]